MCGCVNFESTLKRLPEETMSRLMRRILAAMREEGVLGDGVTPAHIFEGPMTRMYQRPDGTHRTGFEIRLGIFVEPVPGEGTGEGTGEGRED